MKEIYFIVTSLALFISAISMVGSFRLPKSEWECTARDVRDKSCVEYGLIKFPKKVEYNKAID